MMQTLRCYDFCTTVEKQHHTMDNTTTVDDSRAEICAQNCGLLSSNNGGIIDATIPTSDTAVSPKNATI